MINYIFRVSTGSSIPNLTVVRAHTVTDALELIRVEFTEPDDVEITLVECCTELVFLN